MKTFLIALVLGTLSAHTSFATTIAVSSENVFQSPRALYNNQSRGTDVIKALVSLPADSRATRAYIKVTAQVVISPMFEGAGQGAVGGNRTCTATQVVCFMKPLPYLGRTPDPSQQSITFKVKAPASAPDASGYCDNQVERNITTAFSIPKELAGAGYKIACYSEIENKFDHMVPIGASLTLELTGND